MSTWQLYQQSQHYLPFLLMSQTSIADIQGPIKKKKTNHNWYFSRYIHYRNLGDLHEKERRELQENQVRELEYSFTIVNVEEKKTDLHMIFHRYHHAIPPTWINLRKFHIHILWLIPGQTHCGNIPRHLFVIWPLGGSANNSILSLTMNTMG